MDIFGIGAAMRGVMGVYFTGARQTGRTTAMIEAVNDGDRIIFADSKEAARVERLLLHRGKSVTCLTISPRDSRFFNIGTGQGRTIFDHSWVEHYYLNAIDTAGKEIDHFQGQLSGFGEAHYETQSKAREISKWTR